MRRSALAAVAAVVLTTTPIAPMDPAAAFPSALATMTTDSSPVLEVTYRRHCHRDVRRHYHRVIGRSAWHRHIGPFCRVRVVRRHRDLDGCIRIGDLRICF
jgi:hypothetical protein